MKKQNNKLKKAYIAAVVAVPVVVAIIALILILPKHTTVANARTLMADKKYYDAINMLEQLCEQNKTFYKGRVALLDAYMAIGSYDKADDVLASLKNKELSKKDAEIYDTHLSFLNNYYFTISNISNIWDSSDFDGTRQAIKDMLNESRYMQSVIYWYLCGTSETAQESIENLEICIEKDPRMLSAYLALGNLYRTVGDIESARNVYKAALDVDATDCGGLYGLGVLELLTGEPSVALTKIQAVHDMYGNVNYIPEALALALIENDQGEQADQFIAACKETEYTFSQAFTNCSLGLSSLEDYYMSQANTEE